MSNIVKYEQAVRLKEIGFDKECLFWYNENGTKECLIEQGYMEYYYEVDCFLNDWNAKKIDRDLYGSYPPKESYSAPTVSEALDYIREEKGVICWIQFVNTGDNGKWKGVFTIDRVLFTDTDYFDTHPLASSALLTAVLGYLEKKGGEE